MSFNQVLRYVGFSTGSAASAAVLAAHTARGQALPDDRGYTVAALLGCGSWLVTGVVSLLLPRVRPRAAPSLDRDEQLRLAEESVADAVPYDEGAETEGARAALARPEQPPPHWGRTALAARALPAPGGSALTTPTDQPDERPEDAPEADYLEQHQAALPQDVDETEGPVVVDPDVEANPADVLEQAAPVPVDDDEPRD